MEVDLLQDWTSAALFITPIAHFRLKVLPVFTKNTTATKAFPLPDLLSRHPDYYWRQTFLLLLWKDRPSQAQDASTLPCAACKSSLRQNTKSSHWPTPLLRFCLFFFLSLFPFYPSFPSFSVLPQFITLEQPAIPYTNTVLSITCHINPSSLTLPVVLQ